MGKSDRNKAPLCEGLEYPGVLVSIGLMELIPADAGTGPFTPSAHGAERTCWW